VAADSKFSDEKSRSERPVGPWTARIWLTSIPAVIFRQEIWLLGRGAVRGVELGEINGVGHHIQNGLAPGI